MTLSLPAKKLSESFLPDGTLLQFKPPPPPPQSETVYAQVSLQNCISLLSFLKDAQLLKQLYAAKMDEQPNKPLDLAKLKEQQLRNQRQKLQRAEKILELQMHVRHRPLAIHTIEGEKRSKLEKQRQLERQKREEKLQEAREVCEEVRDQLELMLLPPESSPHHADRPRQLRSKQTPKKVSRMKTLVNQARTGTESPGRRSSLKTSENNSGSGDDLANPDEASVSKSNSQDIFQLELPTAAKQLAQRRLSCQAGYQNRMAVNPKHPQLASANSPESSPRSAEPGDYLKHLERQQLEEYNLFIAMISNVPLLIQTYNSRLSRDAMMQHECQETNSNKLFLFKQLKNLEIELELRRNDWKTNKLLNIHHSDDDKLHFKRQEERLLGSFVRQGTVAGRMSKQEIRVSRAIQRVKEMQHGVKDLRQIEEMDNEHLKFQEKIKSLRKIHEKVRLKFKQLAAALAYRIHLVMEVADVSCPEADIEQIIRGYQRDWPYEPLDVKTAAQQQKSLALAREETHTDIAVLQTLRPDDRRNRQRRQKLIGDKLTTFQLRMQNSNIFKAFEERIDHKFRLMHIRRFVLFLVKQKEQMKKPKNRAEEVLMKDPLYTDRGEINQREFVEEYEQFMTVNISNLKKAKQFDMKIVQETSTMEQLQLQQLIQLEEKHLKDDYLSKKNLGPTQAQIKIGKMKQKFNSSAQLY